MKSESLKKLLLRAAVIMTAIIIIAAAGAGFFAFGNLNKLMTEVVGDLSETQLNQIDKTLSGMDAYLSGLSNQNYNLSTLVFSNNENERYKASRDIAIEMSRTISQYSEFGGIFMIADTGQRLEYINADGIVLSGNEQLAIKNHVLGLVETQDDSLFQNVWFHLSLLNTSYLMRIYARGSTYCGAWVSVDTLLSNIRETDIVSRGAAYLLDYDGTPLGKEGQPAFATGTEPKKTRLDGDSYVQINSYSASMPFILALFFNSGEVNRFTAPIIRLFILFALAMVVTLAFVGVMVKRRLYAPIQEFAQAMLHFGQTGEISPADEDTGFEEIQKLASTYNWMSGQITQLKIDAYEEKLAHQEVHMQYLKTQIQPHFFMNALNVIYSFAQVKEYGHIQQMSLCLVQYFRYILSDAALVRLEQELEHARNYINIQNYRYPGNFIYTEDIAPESLNMQVPVLAVQTFLENSVKYALEIDRQNTITVKAAMVKDRLEITISDSGPGFAPDVLERLNAGQPLLNKEGGVGIANLRKRAAILYGNKAALVFDNPEEGGARAAIYLPDTAAQMEGSNVYNTSG